MKHRTAIYKDCQKCNEPPNCSTAPERCNIQVEVIEVGDIIEVTTIEATEHLPVMSLRGKRAYVKFMDGEIRSYPIVDLILIHKIKKHVFTRVKEVRIVDKDMKVFDFQNVPCITLEEIDNASL